ncbi:hypothetical protein LT493_03905 [Streptomyces tricolor]|nr:hypothetical protein [Streptomyces tricolor]
MLDRLTPAQRARARAAAVPSGRRRDPRLAGRRPPHRSAGRAAGPAGADRSGRTGVG